MGKEVAGLGNPYVVAKEFSWKYIGKAYLLSFMFVAIFLVIHFLKGFPINLLIYTVASSILFPFAKYVYDTLIGFWIQKKEIEATYQHRSAFVYHRMDNVGIVLTFVLSIFLAPIGILYLLLRALYRFAVKTRKE